MFVGAKCRARTPSSRFDRPALAFSVRALRAVLRLMRHRRGSARCQRSCVGTSPPHHLRPRSSKVEFNLAAIPPHLCRDESRQKCSGHPGSGPSARWRRLCQSSFQGFKTFALAAPPRCQPQTAPGGTVSALISSESFDSALLWAVPAQAPERVCLTPPSVGLCRRPGA